MDQFDIYVNVDRPAGNPGKRKAVAKHSENIYENEDKTNTLKLNRTETAPSGAGDGKQVKKNSCIGAAVFLGLLCLLLLTAVITLVLLFTKSNSELEMEMILLNNSYNNMSREMHQLQTSYNNMNEERDQLQTSYNQMATDRIRLQRRVQELTNRNNRNRKFEGWVYFRGNLYHTSTTKKTWQQSRDDCRQKGADLVVINSKDEQAFINQFKTYVWIGLTDSEKEGTWKWVDGTPMTASYWGSGEPNGGTGENCGDIKNFSAENSWNDESCSISLFFICETKI